MYKSNAECLWHRCSRLVRKGLVCFGILFLLPMHAWAADLLVTLTDAQSEQPLVSESIYLYEIDDQQKRHWRGRQTSNESGQVTFDIDENLNYQLLSKAYNRFYYFTPTFSGLTEYPIQLGNLPVQLKDGSTPAQASLADTRVWLYKFNADGRKQYAGSATSDENGVLKFTFNTLDADNQYVIAATSLVNGHKKYSAVISDFSTTEFVVGNLPVVVNLSDASTEQTLADKRVWAYEVLEDGKRKWRQSVSTDETGQAKFDLDGMNEGRQYYAATRVFNNYTVKTDILEPAQTLDWAIGTTQVTVLNGSVDELSHLTEWKVDIIRKDEDRDRWFSRANTDEQGQLKIDLPGLDEGTQYVLRAASAVDGSRKYSQIIDATGAIDFTVGGKALEFQLRDGQNQTPIADTRVYAYIIDDNGKARWKRRFNTDQTGQAILDLTDLDNGAEYFFRTKVFNNKHTYSDAVTSSGEFIFDVGTTLIKLNNGNLADDSVLANQTTWLYRVNSDGRLKYHATVVADENGEIRVNLDPDQTYKLKVKSPSGDGKSQYYALNTDATEIDLNVGTPLLIASVTDAKSGSALAGVEVKAYRVEGDKRHYFQKQFTDENGQINFDLPGIDSGTLYQLATHAFNGYPSMSQVLSQPGNVNLEVGAIQVQVKDNSTGNPVNFANKQVEIRRYLDNGSLKWHGRFNTDDNGVLRIDFAPNYNQYRLSAKSAINESVSYSLDVNANGVYELVVGTPALTTTLLDARSQTPLVNQRVDAYRLNADTGKWHWFTRANSDDAGKIDFDLPHINSGSQYKLKAVVYNNQHQYSDVLTQSGQLTWTFGNTLVSLIDGSGQQANLANHRINIERLNEEGKFRYFGSAYSDDTGLLKLDMPQIGEGTSYRLRAHSLLGQYKYSETLTANGDYQFIVGNQATVVTLNDYLTGQVIADKRVTASYQKEDGGYAWYQSVTTDENGQATFDLDGIDDKRNYRFSAKVYNNLTAYSDLASQSGSVNFAVGQLPITLIDNQNETLLPEKQITLYRITGEQRLQWLARTRTDEAGMIRFDATGLDDGDRFVVKVSNPFGNNKHFYGPVITTSGAIDFRVDPDSPTRVDLTVPQISIDGPSSDIAFNQGFDLFGQVSDDQAIADVVVQLFSQNVLIATQQAAIDAEAGSWSYSVTADQLTDLQDLAVVVTAKDFALNEAQSNASYQVRGDENDPEIVVSSHGNQQAVNVTGFTLAGTVTDDIKVQSVALSLVDPLLGTTIDNVNIGFAEETGLWAYNVTSGLVSDNQKVTVQLTATDIAGKQTQYALELFAIANELNPLHLLGRITYGATPELLQRVYQGESEQILQEQLNPNTIDDSIFEMAMGDAEPTSLDELKQMTLQHMLLSKRQLREVMTQFWDNHFNTNFRTSQNVAWEWAENQGFRQHALGNFRDLLAVSAKSPAMIYYLNNAQNNVGAPNENYAREIMELHTMGEGNGYTSADVAELARIFTGWHEANGQFFFNDAQHDFGDKQFLGTTIIGAGLAEGEQVLDILASHPSTAEYICSKLLTTFVSEATLSNLQSQCQSEYLSSNGHIASVLTVILGSDEFDQAGETRDKIKTPLELVAGTARNFDAQINWRDLSRAVDGMGYDMFEFPVPTGYSEYGSDWLSTNAIRQRIRFASRAMLNSQEGITVEVTALLRDNGYQSDVAIVNYLADLALAGNISDTERTIALDILSPETAFSWDDQDAEQKVRRLMAWALSLPGYQYQ